MIFVVDCNEEDKKPPWYLVEGAKALSAALKTWTHKREVGCIGRKLKSPGKKVGVFVQNGYHIKERTVKAVEIN